jgi:hypothetical protein
MEKTKVVNILGRDAFRFLGFDFRRKLNREKSQHCILLTPKKNSHLAAPKNNQDENNKHQRGSTQKELGLQKIYVSRASTS